MMKTVLLKIKYITSQNIINVLIIVKYLMQQLNK